MKCLPLESCKEYMNMIASLDTTHPVRELFETAIQDFDEVAKFMTHDERFFQIKLADMLDEPNLELNLPDIDNPILRKFNQQAIAARFVIARCSISASEDEQTVQIKDQVNTFVTYGGILENWKTSKQIYSIHRALEDDFIKMDELEFPISVLDKLPYRTFYLEFANDSAFKSSYDGCFVHVVTYQRGYELYIARIQDTNFICDVFEVVPGDDGIVIFNKNDDVNVEGFTADKELKDFGMFVVNSLLYICAANSEIVESDVTKQTYRPSKTVRNKFSEVRKYECGFKYGEAVMLHKKKKKASAPQVENEKLRVGKRPHSRRAHWHHYRVGPGRKEVVLKWVAPMYIHKEHECIATIHSVKK